MTDTRERDRRVVEADRHRNHPSCFEGCDTMEPMDNFDPRHPHEPEIPPALDAEGCCLVCGILCRVDEQAQEAREARLNLWLAVAKLVEQEKRLSSLPPEGAREELAADGEHRIDDMDAFRHFALVVVCGTLDRVYLTTKRSKEFRNAFGRALMVYAKEGRRLTFRVDDIPPLLPPDAPAAEASVQQKGEE